MAGPVSPREERVVEDKKASAGRRGAPEWPQGMAGKMGSTASSGSRTRRPSGFLEFGGRGRGTLPGAAPWRLRDAHLYR